MTKKDFTNSPNITETEILELKKLFPKFFSEWEFNLEWFRDYLNWQTTNDKEFYRFEWTWKQESKMIANKPTKNTLLPDEVNSKDWDTTENIFIEWDNLEVLKLLQNKYFGQIKMIYIDPPYNKDKDFVYKDTWKDSLEDYLLQTWQVDEDGETTTQKETTWRKHSNWLNMIYPRLLLARRLLKEDWVIFVSIDDDEVHNLRKVMDEIFWEDNFLAEFVWNWKSGAEDDWNIRNNKEYIISYCKELPTFDVWLDIKKDEKFIYYDENKKDYYKRQLLRKWWDNSKREDRPNLYYSIIDDNWKEFFPTLPNWEDWCWRWWKEKMEKAIKNWIIEFVKNWRYEAYEKIYQSDETRKNKKFQSLLLDVWQTADWTKEIKNIFDDKIFDRPKPSTLINHFIKISNVKENDIILDFFAWSWTTAHAVMELNKEDSWNRKFICVQLPEKTDKNSVANKEWYEFISQITRERIKRAWEKIKNEIVGNDGHHSLLDIWFRAFKLSESNFKYMSEKYEINENTDLEQIELLMQKEIEESWLVEWRSDYDVIYELIIREWYSFNSKIEKQEFWIYKIIDTNENFFYFITETKTDEELQKFIKTNLSIVDKKNISLFALEEKLNESQRVTLSSYFKLVNL